MPVLFQKRDRDYVGYTPRAKPRYREVSRAGEVYDIGGVEVELFKIKVFSEAIDRTDDVVKKWTKKGHIPPPLYAVTGHVCKNWYSREQVINCNRLFMGRWKGKKYLSRPGEFETFVADLKEVFYAKGIVVDEKGNIIGRSKEKTT